MKVIAYKLGVIFTGVLFFTGCSSDMSSGDITLQNEADSLSYSLGYQNGQFLNESDMKDVNPDLVKAGLQAALDEQDAELSENEMQQVIQQFQIKARQKAQQKRMDDANNNKEKGEQFLAENKEKEGVQVTESGLQYKVLEEGSGATPGETDEVRVDYEGTLVDGTVFDSSYERGESTTFPVNRVIPGWTEGLQLMKEGSKYMFYIPGDLAYGENPPPGSDIGTNETLVFEVELHEVNPEDSSE